MRLLVCCMGVMLCILAGPGSVRSEGEAPAETLPAAVRLDGLKPVWQQYNRCASAAFTMLISYFGWQGSYDDMMRALNPHAEDVNVRLDEMIAFAEQQGLAGVARNGGTVDVLRALVAAGFPVLVETAYYEGSPVPRNWMSHNRVVMGYDDSAQSFYLYDSLLGFGDGTGRPIPYEQLDDEWRHFSRDYLVLYRPEDEALLRETLGSQWEAEANALWTLEQAEAELAGDYPDDPFSLFNLGAAQVILGDYEAAAASFDQARALDLPWRLLWYRFEPFEAYLAVGRTEDVLALVQQVLGVTPGVEEMYYYAGKAYEAQGNLERAEANYREAIQRNTNFTAAAQALAMLTG